jgi:hypothetical protein
VGRTVPGWGLPRQDGAHAPSCGHAKPGDPCGAAPCRGREEAARAGAVRRAAGDARGPLAKDAKEGRRKEDGGGVGLPRPPPVRSPGSSNRRLGFPCAVSSERGALG